MNMGPWKFVRFLISVKYISISLEAIFKPNVPIIRVHSHPASLQTYKGPMKEHFFCGTATQRGSWPPHSWGFLDHIQRCITFGRTLLDEWSPRRRDLYLTTHNTHNRQTSMPPVGFEPTISAGERPQTYALDSTATGTGNEGTYSAEISGFHTSPIAMRAGFTKGAKGVIWKECSGIKCWSVSTQ